DASWKTAWSVAGCATSWGATISGSWVSKSVPGTPLVIYKNLRRISLFSTFATNNCRMFYAGDVLCQNAPSREGCFWPFLLFAPTQGDSNDNNHGAQRP